MVVKPMEDITASKINNNIENTPMSGHSIDNMCPVEPTSSAIPPVFRTRNNQKHLKDLLSLQLDLIEHQQLKIIRKDKQILGLRSEKEQLEARLNRMERRLAVHKRNSIDTDETKTKTCSTRPSVVPEKPKAIPMGFVTVSSKTNKPIDSNGCMMTNFAYLDDKNTSVVSLLLDKHKEDRKKKDIDVSVPPWKVIVRDKLETIDDALDEDISDEMFEKRHIKPENEEKKRKRWDLQQARQQEQHEMLVQKYNERNKQPNSKVQPSTPSLTGVVSSTIPTTFYKDVDHALAVHVGDIVPVCSFGYSLPAIEPEEMDLPWFDVDKRENQIRNNRLKEKMKAEKMKSRKSKLK